LHLTLPLGLSRRLVKRFCHESLIQRVIRIQRFFIAVCDSEHGIMLFETSHKFNAVSDFAK
jgi:hypothetical protein